MPPAPEPFLGELGGDLAAEQKRGSSVSGSTLTPLTQIVRVGLVAEQQQPVALTAAVVLVVRDLGAVADAGLWTEGLPFHTKGAFRGA